MLTVFLWILALLFGIFLMLVVMARANHQPRKKRTIAPPTVQLEFPKKSLYDFDKELETYIKEYENIRKAETMTNIKGKDKP